MNTRRVKLRGRAKITQLRQQDKETQDQTKNDNRTRSRETTTLDIDNRQDMRTVIFPFTGGTDKSCYWEVYFFSSTNTVLEARSQDNEHSAWGALAGARMPLDSNGVVLVRGVFGLGSCNGSGERVSTKADSVTQRPGATTRRSCEQLGVQVKHWFNTQRLSDSVTQRLSDSATQ